MEKSKQKTPKDSTRKKEKSKEFLTETKRGKYDRQSTGQTREIPGSWSRKPCHDRLHPVTSARSLRDFEGRKGNGNQKQRNLRAERKGKRGESRPESATPAAGEGERRPKNTLTSAISGRRGAVFGASVAGGWGGPSGNEAMWNTAPLTPNFLSGCSNITYVDK